VLPVHEAFSWIDPETRLLYNDEATESSINTAITAGSNRWPYTIQRERNGYKPYQIFAGRTK